MIGAFNNLEKYEFVNGKDDNPYTKWQIMFETTNQYILYTCTRMNAHMCNTYKYIHIEIITYFVYI